MLWLSQATTLESRLRLGLGMPGGVEAGPGGGGAGELAAEDSDAAVGVVVGDELMAAFGEETEGDGVAGPDGAEEFAGGEGGGGLGGGELSGGGDEEGECEGEEGEGGEGRAKGGWRGRTRTRKRTRKR